MTTTDLEQAYAKLREIKIKLSSLRLAFETDSDEDLSGDDVLENFNQMIENIVDVMTVVKNKL